MTCKAVAVTLAALLAAACGGEPSAGPSLVPGSTAAPAPAPSPAPAPTPAPGPGSPATVRLNEDLGGRALFPSDNWWNQDISRAPVDSQSGSYIAFIGAARTAHPDFGPPPYGIPYVGVSGSETRTAVTFVDYGSESDAGAGGVNGYPIPEAAKTQANFIEGAVPGGGTSGDRHLLIVDRDRWLLYELFATRWNAAAARWEAGSGAIFDLSANSRRPEGASAAPWTPGGTTTS